MIRTNSRWMVVLVVAIILAFFGWRYFASSIHTVNSVAVNGTYSNKTYGYSFEYPQMYSANEYSPQVVGVGVPTSDVGPLVEVGISSSGTSTVYKNFAAFVHAKSELYCDADGPTGSLRCPSILNSTPFTSGNGIQGEKFYMKLVLTTKGHATSTSFGPVYAFNISANVPGVPMTALIVRPSLSTFSNDGASLAAYIANTVQVSKMETRSQK